MLYGSQVKITTSYHHVIAVTFHVVDKFEKKNEKYIIVCLGRSPSFFRKKIDLDPVHSSFNSCMSQRFAFRLNIFVFETYSISPWFLPPPPESESCKKLELDKTKIVERLKKTVSQSIFFLNIESGKLDIPRASSGSTVWINLIYDWFMWRGTRKPSKLLFRLPIPKMLVTSLMLSLDFFRRSSSW